MPFKVREAIEEEQYTIWPSNTVPGIEKFVVSINPITQRVDLSTFFNDNAIGTSVNKDKVLNQQELIALDAQVKRITSICRDRYKDSIKKATDGLPSW